MKEFRINSFDLSIINLSKFIKYMIYQLGIESIVKSLLQNGFNVNLKDDKEWTPLISAVFKGNLNRIIIGNWWKKSKNTILLFILVKENVVKLLLENGADVNATTSDGKSALHWAVYRSIFLLYLFLLKKSYMISFLFT